ncbi:hypothetical protein U9M48_011563 [Paspalum notatum var. saurae]|uniref:F-box domain-containing protein n=1 Tax=Paspalum notatum var. saurae TaxID=547442 RepID=A0AAQ3SVP2_PASNO
MPGCDHLDCQGGPFGVVIMTTDEHEELVKATIYSSETGVWSMPVSLNGTDCEAYAQYMRDAHEKLWCYYVACVESRRGAVIGDGIYFTLQWRKAIVNYDLCKNRFSIINPPTPDNYDAALKAMEDSSLGFAFVEGSKLQLWSRKVNSEGDAGWVQCKAIELATIIPVDSPSDEDGLLVVGSAEGVGVIFVCTGAGLFAIEIKSGQVRKVDGVYFSILLYMSFYTPGILMDELVGEILLRLPPDEPEHLFRAAFVCKPWLRILCHPAFRRRYRVFHGAPPLLGLLHRRQVLQGDPPARFASTTSMPDFPHPGAAPRRPRPHGFLLGLRRRTRTRPPNGRHTRPLDCRHGRVLIHMLEDERADYLLVWDPVTGDRHAVPQPDVDCLVYSAAVFCDAVGCDHLDCHGGPFRVVFVATLEDRYNICASAYSSMTAAWSAPVILDEDSQSYVQHMRQGRAGRLFYTPYLQPRRGTLVGDAVYFTIRRDNTIVKYDWSKDSLFLVDPPPPQVYYIALIAMDDGSLGFACIEGSSLYLWSRKVNSGGAAEWVQCWAIELETIIPVAESDDEPLVVGSAEGLGVIFISTDVGLFRIKLSSGQVKKVNKSDIYFSVLPYMSFYTPGMLMDDIVSEILLRVPSDEPEHLFRAALVCKPWLRVLCDPAFLRRYSAFHRAPPLLGLLHRLMVMQGDPAPRLSPTTAAPLSPYPDYGHSRALDCRHGRALLHVADGGWHLIVWDPVTGDRHVVPEPPDLPWLIYSAAVCCAVPGCDHLDCHGGPFRVIFMATHDHKELVTATVYSSETGAWSLPVSLGTECEAYARHRRDAVADLLYYIPYVQPRRGAVIGDEAYFTLRWGNAIVIYDLGKNCFSLISPPTPYVYDDVALMEMEDRSLGFARTEGSKLYLWSRKVNSDGAAEWVQCKAIELATSVLVAKPGDEPYVVGSAEGVGVIFISTGAGLFTIELKSGRVKKVDGPGVYFSVLPYMSFYTPSMLPAVAFCLLSCIFFTASICLLNQLVVVCEQ